MSVSTSMATFPIQQPAQRAVLAIAIVFSVLTFLFVSLRLLAHHKARKPWTVSDHLVIVAAVLAIGLQGISIAGVLHAGIGYGHVIDVVTTYGPEPITLLLKLLIPLQFLWVLSLSLSKSSILLLYIRIFPVPYIVKTAWATMAVIAAWAVATILAGCLICRPIEMNWNPDAGGACGDQVLSFTVTGIINLLTDVVVLFLPMPAMFRLQLATYKKVTLIGVFGLGAVTCVISGLRISVLSSMDFADITHSIPLANIFSCLEPCIAIILSCVPLLRPLLGRSAAFASAPSGYQGQPADDKVKSGFQPLDDDSSQYNLRPAGPKHHAEVSASRPRTPADGDEVELAAVGEGQPREAGISVRQEWEVSEGRTREGSPGHMFSRG